MTYKGGIILINKNKIALVYRDYYNDYSFPKGHLEENETLIECAIRETEEEIKRKVKLISEKEIYIERYTTPKGEKCECHYYLGYDDLIWIDFDKVEEVLSYDSLKKLWNKIKDKVGEYIND